MSGSDARRIGASSRAPSALRAACAAGVVAAIMSAAACGDRNGTEESATGGAESGAAAPPAKPTEAAPGVSGERVYRQHCLTCHQPYGGGVPGLQPPLTGSEVVTGDIDYLVEMLVRGVRSGPESLPGSDEWSSSMPSFDFLSNEEIAAVLTHVRTSWGNDAAAATAEEVAEARSAEPAR